MVRVSLHDGIILTNCVLPAVASNQIMRAQAKLGLSLYGLNGAIHVFQGRHSKYFIMPLKALRTETYLKLTHAHKSGPNIADNFKPNLLSGVGNLEKATVVPCLG